MSLPLLCLLSASVCVDKPVKQHKTAGLSVFSVKSEAASIREKEEVKHFGELNFDNDTPDFQIMEAPISKGLFNFHIQRVLVKPAIIPG